jgi:hypothetical protein
MEQKQITATYAEAVKAIKEAILESRYRAARLVNKEVGIMGTVLLIHFTRDVRRHNVCINKQ